MLEIRIRRYDLILSLLRSDVEFAPSYRFLQSFYALLVVSHLIRLLFEGKRRDHITYARREAYAVGIDEYAVIIDNGDGSLGTVLHRTCPEFQEVYKRADVIIAKGQANYECLSDENKNIYFLLMTKCDVIANNIGVEEKKMICMKNKVNRNK